MVNPLKMADQNFNCQTINSSIKMALEIIWEGPTHKKVLSINMAWQNIGIATPYLNEAPKYYGRGSTP